MDEPTAKQVEKAYHDLYKVSDAWVQDKLNKASKDGYVTVAFGLRVRTPLLNQVVRGCSKTPHEADSEGRTAGNSLGQSWCLLTVRAGIECNKELRDSSYRLNILPVCTIHDALYYLVKDDADSILYEIRKLPRNQRNAIYLKYYEEMDTPLSDVEYEQ